jgi:hypothetical protein
MNRSQSKIRHIQQSNLLLEKRRSKTLMEGGDDPLLPTSTEKLTMPKLGETQKNILRSNLWNHIQSNDELKHSLGLDNSHNESNFLDKIAHSPYVPHFHYDPSSNHFGVEFSHFGKKHNVSFDLGLGFQKHDNGDDHGHSQLSSLTPHSLVDVGVKIPLESIFGKKS